MGACKLAPSILTADFARLGEQSSNIASVVAAGADVIVAGSAIFRPDATVQQAVAELRMAATPLVR